MRFEARELRPYAEPVDAESLQEGHVYFSVNFVDEDMCIPVLQPLVFVGRNLDGKTPGTVYFQDVDSYKEGAEYDRARTSGDVTFLRGSESEIGHIFEYENALDVLLSCSLRRNQLKE